jgi:peptidoglycan hydrolase-like protein with peptidoglycan-binding domain
MKKFGFIVLVLVFATSLFGCGKKQPTLEEMQQPMSMETLSTMSTTTPAAPETKVEGRAPEAKVEVGLPVVAKVGRLESLPPGGPYKPTGIEIQGALKNAGFYTGSVDGKLGAKTKKAITEFQKANGLSADGKVGPKTWSILSKHLTPEAAPKAR